jgi:xylulose-5-phosphate/fructose-6-phosphate phosphoketolase
MKTEALSSELLHKMDAYWRAANYLSVGQIYLYDNPLLKRPLTLADVKHMLLGHWGTTPGQNFIYLHLNRIINKYDLDMIYVSGPGHGGPAVVGNTYLEGTYSEIYPDISQDEAGLRKLFHSVFVSRRDPQPCFARVSGFDSRGRRIGLFA